MVTLSLLKVLQNWRTGTFLNLALYCGAIWRRRENSIMGAQVQSLRCSPKDILEHLLPVWLCHTGSKFSIFLHTLVYAQTCSFRAVFGLPIRSLTIAVSAICGKNLYILGVKRLTSWNFIKIFLVSIRSCAPIFERHNFRAEFRTNCGTG